MLIEVVIKICTRTEPERLGFPFQWAVVGSRRPIEVIFTASRRQTALLEKPGGIMETAMSVGIELIIEI